MARVLFLGTPEIAASALSALLELGEKPLVVCQPDRPAGRDRSVVASAVKRLSVERGLRVLQPEKIAEVRAEIERFAPDITICCAFGQYVPESILNIPKRGSINIHGSLLPKYRGGAPIQWAVIKGESETGITYMRMTKDMDAGPTLWQERLPIGPTETAGEVFTRMGELIRSSLKRRFPELLAGPLDFKPQDDSQATFAHNLTRADEKISFAQPASSVANLVRGLQPSPGAYFATAGGDVKVLRATPAESEPAPVGTIIKSSKGFLRIACDKGAVDLWRVQLPGKRAVDVSEMTSWPDYLAEGKTV